MPYVIERIDQRGRARFTGMYRAVNGKIRSAGTYDSHERAIEIAAEEEAHAQRLLDETTPAEKSTRTIKEFGDERFLKYHHSSLATRQGYRYVLENHVYPYIGHLRISEVGRETFYNLLIKVLPSEDGECASRTTVLAARKVLSSLCQMAFDEGYRGNNPVRSIKVPQVPTKPVLVANREQWARLESALRVYPPARLYARVNVVTWARTCEMISLRPSDFDFKKQAIFISRSTVYLTSRFHPSGKAGWLTKGNPKNGDHRRFTISKQTCVAVQEHIEEHGIGEDEILFPLWMFAYRRPFIKPAGTDELERLPQPSPPPPGRCRVCAIPVHPPASPGCTCRTSRPPGGSGSGDSGVVRPPARSLRVAKGPAP